MLSVKIPAKETRTVEELGNNAVAAALAAHGLDTDLTPDTKKTAVALLTDKLLFALLGPKHPMVEVNVEEKTAALKESLSEATYGYKSRQHYTDVVADSISNIDAAVKQATRGRSR